MASPAGARSEDWDCLSPEAQRLAEARLAAKRAARAEAREIRMKELERQQKEVEERPDKDFTEKGSRNMPSLSAATLASLGGTSSRRGSGDTSISIDTEASTREIKDSLAEVEEKYKKAMVSNAQLDNEKTNFMYQVDTLKDVLLELEEELAEARRQCEEKGKELERERHAHSVLQFQLAEVKEALRQRDEMLEKHGIILSSEAATSGEAAATPSNVESPSPTQMTKEEMNALRSPGDGALGRAKEVEVEKEIVENVGKREILQNARQERPREVVAQDGAHGEVSYPSENAEGRNASENLKNAECEEQVQRQSPENCEATRQVGSQEVIVLAKETGASLASPKCPEDFDSGAPGPVHRQDTCNALDGTEQGEKSVGRQDQENQDLKTDREEMQGSPPLLGPEAGRVSCSDPGEPGGGHTEKELEVGTAAVEAPGSLHGNRPADELDSGAGHSAEKALTEQEAAGPAEASTQSTAGREDSGEQEGGAETKGEKPGQVEAQAIPGAPTAQNSQDEAPGPGTTDADREPSEGKSSVQAEASDSAQKKSRNKKKKNKKKKSPAPVESLDDVRKELTYQNMDEGEVREELEPGTDQMPVAEAPEEVTEEATNSSVAGAGSGERVGFPEAELDGKLNQEEENGKAEDGSREAARDTRDGAGGTSQPAEGVTNGCGVGTTGVTPGAEAMGETRSSLQPSAGSTVDACDTGSSEWPETSQQQSQTVLEAADGVGLEKGDLSVPLGEPGDLDSESGGHGKEGSEKGKGKEDCTMS